MPEQRSGPHSCISVQGWFRHADGRRAEGAIFPGLVGFPQGQPQCLGQIFGPIMGEVFLERCAEGSSLGLFLSPSTARHT